MSPRSIIAVPAIALLTLCNFLNLTVPARAQTRPVPLPFPFAMPDYRDGTHQLATTRILAKGGAVPPDLHDIRQAGEHLIGQSFTRTLLVAGKNLEGAMIESEGYGKATAFGILVANLRLDGNQTLNHSYRKYHGEEHSVADGVRLCGLNHTVTGLWIERLKGYGITLVATDDEPANFPTFPINRIIGNTVTRSFGGIQVEVADTEVADNLVAAVRDYGLWAKAGNVRINRNHFYGAEIAAVRLGANSTTGPAQVGDTDMSDSPIGCHVVVPGCKIADCYSQGCSVNFQVEAPGTRISGTTVSVNKYKTPTGVDFAPNSHGSCFLAGMINLGAAEAVGIHVRSHAVAVADTALNGGDLPRVTGLRLNSPHISGQTYHIQYAQGFDGNGSVAIDIVEWGENNTIYISGLLAEAGTPPRSAGRMIRIAAGTGSTKNWNKGNRIYVGGVQLTSGKAYAP